MSIAHHEAGHAIACLLTGHRLHHVTVVPTDRSGGHAAADEPVRWSTTPAWFPYGITVAAGMAGEAAALAYFGHTRAKRPDIAAAGGGGSRPFYDTSTLRWIARGVWTSAHDEGTPAEALGPEFNPAWIETPDGVRDIAAHIWQATVRMMCQRPWTISRLAHHLAARDTLTGDQVAWCINRRHDPSPIDPELVGTDFWVADHSRLAWRPYGMSLPGRTQDTKIRKEAAVH